MRIDRALTLDWVSQRGARDHDRTAYLVTVGLYDPEQLHPAGSRNWSAITGLLRYLRLRRASVSGDTGEMSLPDPVLASEAQRIERMMLGRVPIRRVRSLDEAAAVVASHARKTVLIFDIDNTLARQGAPSAEVTAVVEDAVDRFEAIPTVSRVIVLTNGPQRDVPGIISRGNKPWTSRRRLGLLRSESAIFVMGDQVLTDGVLAWRLDATFLLLVIDDEHEQRGQARMRRIGGIFERLLFSRLRGDDVDES